jgi:hypothetical protein
LEQFAAISLGDLVIKPADNEPEFRGNPPVFEAEALAAGKPFAILQRPLENEECGPATLAGITPAKVNVSNETHRFATADAGVLKSSDSGTARILWKEDGTGEKWAALQVGISEGYSGYFKVSASGISSGCAVVNDALLELPAGAFTLSDGMNFITANFSLDTFNSPVFDGFAASSAFPVPESGKLKILLATVESSNGAISAIASSITARSTAGYSRTARSLSHDSSLEKGRSPRQEPRRRPLSCANCPCEAAAPSIQIRGAFIVLLSDEGFFNRPYWPDYGCYDEATDTLSPPPSAGGYCGAGRLMRYYVDGLDFAPYNVVPLSGDAFNHGPASTRRRTGSTTAASETKSRSRDWLPLVVPYPVISRVARFSPGRFSARPIRSSIPTTAAESRRNTSSRTPSMTAL